MMAVHVHVNLARLLSSAQSANRIPTTELDDPHELLYNQDDDNPV
jgi:hypothetical protein